MMKMSNKQRNCSGGTQAEFTAVFVVFILIILFPLFNFGAIAAIYGAGAALNYDSAREASLVSNSGSVNGAQHVAVDAAGAVAARDARVTQVEKDWAATGLGAFVKKGGGPATPTHTITLTPAAPPLTDEYVRVTTDLDADPFLIIPWPVDAPGINKPMHFTYSQERLIEQ